MWPWRERDWNYVIVAAAEASLSNGRTMSVGVFAGVHVFSLILGRLSASDMVCVFSVRSSLGNAGNWEELGVRFRCRPSWGILWWPMILDSELKP